MRDKRLNSEFKKRDREKIAEILKEFILRSQLLRGNKIETFRKCRNYDQKKKIYR
ncbi:MAG: hypothetical protein CM15mP12_2680 [Gammaproteobacteria bacterium]|nr:MAG: hypothetical protein CM15mP12_2680 [Gammaproteobacteria bacterium]